MYKNNNCVTLNACFNEQAFSVYPSNQRAKRLTLTSTPYVKLASTQEFKDLLSGVGQILHQCAECVGN